MKYVATAEIVVSSSKDLEGATFDVRTYGLIECGAKTSVNNTQILEFNIKEVKPIVDSK